MAISDYPITIDGNNFLIKPNSFIQQYNPSLPPRIRTSATPNFDDLTVWESEGMNSFMGGLGQKKYSDREMYFDNMGTCPWEDEELKLSYAAALFKDFGAAGMNLDSTHTRSRVIRDDADYDSEWWFGNWYGEWDTPTAWGRCPIWSYNGTTLTDRRSTLSVARMTQAISSADVVLTLDTSAGFASGDYVLVTSCEFDGWEVMYVSAVDVGAGQLTVTRAQALTWDVGKTLTYPAKEFHSDSMVYELSYSQPPNMGGGVTSMCVYDNRLYIGTLCGALFMYRGDTNQWFLQPFPPGGNSPFTYWDEKPPWTSPSSKYTTVNFGIDSMCVFRDKLFLASGARLFNYDIAVVDGQNPFGAGKLQEVMASYSLNNMVVFNYAIYFNSWLALERSSALFKYDGTSVYPVYIFDPVTEIRSLKVYDGKIFLGLGRYNYAQTQAVGQVWSYDGLTMRKHFSRPRNDKQDGTLNTIMAMKVINDKLYFSDNYTTGVYIYDAVYDGVHRAHLCDTAYGATSGDVVEGIFNWGDITYISLASKGLFNVSTSNLSVGGVAGQYGGFKYPYLKTSMFGNNFPNVEKLFYKITFWHSPAVSGQKFHLFLSRNQMASYSAEKVITPVVGSVSTSYVFMEEGHNTANPMLLGDFNGTPTGDYGIKAVDMSLVIALESPSATTQFTVYGFVMEYLPINTKETVRIRIMAVDHMRLPSGGYEPLTGREKYNQLETSFVDRRPVVVTHPLLTRGGTKVMLISDMKGVVPDANPAGTDRTNTYYTIEAEALIELTEC